VWLRTAAIDDVSTTRFTVSLHPAAPVNVQRCERTVSPAISFAGAHAIDTHALRLSRAALLSDVQYTIVGRKVRSPNSRAYPIACLWAGICVGINFGAVLALHHSAHDVARALEGRVQELFLRVCHVREVRRRRVEHELRAAARRSTRRSLSCCVLVLRLCARSCRAAPSLNADARQGLHTVSRCSLRSKGRAENQAMAIVRMTQR